MNQAVLNQAVRMPIRVSCWLAALLAGGISASAQVDLPATRDARQVLGRLTDARTAMLDDWLAPIGITARELHGELFRGDAASRAVMSDILQTMRNRPSADSPDATWHDELVQHLEKVSEQLELPAPEHWVTLCRELLVLNDFPTPDSPDRERREAAGRLEAMTRRYPALLDPENAWHRFLQWDLTQRLLSGDELTPAELDSLEVRWRNARLPWTDFEMLETAILVESVIPRIRGWRERETEPERQAAWSELGEILQEGGWRDESQGQRLVSLAKRRESLGELHPITRSIRRQWATPNLQIEVHRRAWKPWLPVEIRRSYPVSGVFGGAPTRGTGQMEGQLDIQLRPAPLSAKWLVQFQGNSRASTTATADRVRVQASSTTGMSGTAEYAWDQRGIRALEPDVDADAAIRYERVDAWGTRIRRRVAQQRTYGRRSWAERDTQRAAEDQVAEELSGIARQLRRAEEELIQKPIRDRWLATNRLLPEIRVSSDRERLVWSCRLAGTRPSRFTPPLPNWSCAADIQLALAETALEHHLTAAWGGRTLTGEALARELSSFGLRGYPSATSPSSDPVWGDLEVAFRDEPCRVRFEDGVIEMTFACEHLRLGGTVYPPLRILVAYRSHLRAQDLVWTRAGPPEVRFDNSGDEANLLSGRQQTLRLVVQRRLARLFPGEQRVLGPSLESLEGAEVRWCPTQQQLQDGWWQLGFTVTQGDKPHRE